MDMSRFTESQIAKAKACKDQNELMELAKSEGIELADEDLDAMGCHGRIYAWRELSWDKTAAAILREIEARRSGA